MSKKQELKSMNIVKAVKPPKGYENQYPWKEGDAVLFLGEIQNMPGHVAVVTRDGKVHWGYHPESFRPATVDEV